MSVIVTHQLTRRYGRRVGIQDLDLQVSEGVVFGFLGPNGAGKTTTIRVLLGLLRPSAGSARVFGMDCWRGAHRIKADVGYLPGDLRLYPWMSCREALRVFGRVRNRELSRPGAELAEEFGLEPDVRVRTMSRGMRQKLGLILALAHEPKLLVLDEPTASLDPIMQEILRERLRNMAARGHTIFFSSHTLGEVERLCDRVAILREGKLVADETMHKLREQARREVVIRWQDGAAGQRLASPEFLHVHRRDGREWHATLTGPVMELVRWSAGQRIEDLSIGQPDLQSLFRSFYEPGADAG